MTFERAVLRSRDRGITTTDIARRFLRSPAHIERLIAYTGLPHRQAAPHRRDYEMLTACSRLASGR